MAQHDGQITKTPAVGGSPTCKLISMYLHNEANHISLGVQRLCIMGDTVSPGLGGWEQKWAKPEAGSLRTWETLCPLVSLPSFSFSSGASGPEPSEVRILPGGEDPGTKDGTPRMVSRGGESGRWGSD